MEELQMSDNITTAEVKIKPLSSNGFLAFFQKIWRWWIGVWSGFSDKHPKLSKLIYRIFFFIVFSEGVTIYQYLIFLFLPQAFGLRLAQTEWLWPGWVLGTDAAGNVYKFALLGKTLVYDNNGNAVIGGGLGYFFAFLFATFTAQCINFPLQRNITFKSKGNPWYQFMWYIIGWIFIQPFCDGLISVYKWLVGCVIGASIPVFLLTLLDTIIMGGVSMVIFFFIFLVIFPDLNKMAANAQKKVEKLEAAGADPEKIAAAKAYAKEIGDKARLDNARKEEISASSIANSKAVTWDATKKRAEKLEAKGAESAKIEAAKNLAEEKYAAALEAAIKRDQAIAAYAEVKKELGAE